MFEILKDLYNRGVLKEEDLQMAVAKTFISDEELAKIQLKRKG